MINFNMVDPNIIQVQLLYHVWGIDVYAKDLMI